MARKFVIVEHDNDKHTFEAILRFMQNQEIEVRSTEIDWGIRSADPNPEMPTGLKKSLQDLFKEIKKEKYDKIGIILDLDTYQPAQRIALVNTALRLAKQASEQDDPNLSITCEEIIATNQFVKLTVNQASAEIACYFVHYQGRGELEDVLKAIKSQASPIADCVNIQMPLCLEQNAENSLNNKALVKLWLNNYVRYDTLSANQRQESFTKWENVMQNRSAIFDFSKPELDELKAFLNELLK